MYIDLYNFMAIKWHKKYITKKITIKSVKFNVTHHDIITFIYTSSCPVRIFNKYNFIYDSLIFNLIFCLSGFSDLVQLFLFSGFKPEQKDNLGQVKFTIYNTCTFYFNIIYIALISVQYI